MDRACPGPSLTWFAPPKLFEESGFRRDPLAHIFRQRPCLPEEINPKHPDRNICPSWFEHFKFDGARELLQDNIFALEKVVSVPVAPRAPPVVAEPVGGAQGWTVKEDSSPPKVNVCHSPWPFPSSPGAEVTCFICEYENILQWLGSLNMQGAGRLGAEGVIERGRCREA